MPETPEKKYTEDEYSPALFEEVMQPVDILMANNFDKIKIGEIIRLVEYLRALAKNEKAVLPEPDQELLALANKHITISKNKQINISPDENFARSIYQIIPERAKNLGWKKALELLKIITEDLVKSLNEKDK